ncbi:Outer membrane receptor proteins, mostly Fe transport [Capnocytophaga haemolytica]|uniref:Bifunctional enterobactin receptor/adhesin protein n=1 Tax=Capnocytophaga haemolytica TaxID=45243 RepID=A0AAX2H380_9FLAO|nr:carboxypeptidase-like regulatory domain-containing protein [Capnocytophaga haemolytica]AMD85811.1 TonB-dependent receptor [Capnocytophaga haemolytica]SFN81547.1 Outer membrane receptor proteins, mostly Fe transport [Capnocytophaga haemolytica]SNV15772.1 bifunctional enterobactin receptor/adhesin protein [Capnocytophaga haemolytica]
MRKYILLLLVFSSFYSFAQSFVQGKILLSEEGKTHTEAGVDVYWQGTTIGTTTDDQGHFKLLYKPEHKTLVVSYLGFKSAVVNVADPVKFITLTLKEDANELEAVEVTYKRKPTERLNLATANVMTINSGELLKAACCNLSDSFETNSTVEVSTSDAVTGVKQIKMLGLSSPYLLVTQENVPFVRGASQVYGMTFIPGTWVESVQLIKGAGSVINGYEGIAGQINTELVKPLLDKPLFLNLYGSADGRYELNAHYNTQVAKHWYTGLYLHGDVRRQREDMNGDGFLDMPLGQQVNVMNRWQYANPESGWMSNIILQYMNDERLAGQKGFHLNSTPQLWGSHIRTQQLNTMGKAGYVWKEMPYQSIGFQLDYKHYDQQSFYGHNDYNITQNSAYFNAIFKSIIGNTKHKFTTGLSAALDDYTEAVATAQLAGDYDRNDYGAGAFLEYAYDNNDNFSLTAGLRGDYHNRLGAFLTPRVHLRYRVWKDGTLRLSAGRGKRQANIFAEHQNLFSTARAIRLLGNGDSPYGLKPEIAWNYGASFTQKFNLFSRPLEVVLDFYRTDFENQVVVDWDNPREVSFYNLNGSSYANSFQAEVNYELLKRLQLRLAYKWYEVLTDYASGRRWQPLQAKNRLMANLSYETNVKDERQWRFDATLNAIGSQRLPDTSANPQAYRLGAYSKAYQLVNAQITRVFSKRIEAYVGGENLTDYQQQNAILAADDPFGTYFDASMTYAPVFGRMFYAGVRINF